MWVKTFPLSILTPGCGEGHKQQPVLFVMLPMMKSNHCDTEMHIAYCKSTSYIKGTMKDILTLIFCEFSSLDRPFFSLSSEACPFPVFTLLLVDNCSPVHIDHFTDMPFITCPSLIIRVNCRFIIGEKIPMFLSLSSSILSHLSMSQ